MLAMIAAMSDSDSMVIFVASKIVAVILIVITFWVHHITREIK